MLFEFESGITSGNAGGKHSLWRKLLDKSSPLHVIIGSKIILPLAHLQEAALRKYALCRLLKWTHWSHAKNLAAGAMGEDSQIFSNGKMKSDQACLLSLQNVIM